MKYLFFVLLFLCLQASAQQVDILLIGVSHNYGNAPAQDVSSIYNKIRKFAPTAFFGEFLSKEDEQNNMDYWCKTENRKRLENLRKNRNINEDQLPQTIDRLKKMVESNPNDYRARTDLAHAYYLNQDVSNAHYQYWQVYTQLEKAPDATLAAYVKQLLSPELDVSGRSMKRLKTSEYDLIAFPMMQELHTTALLPMDCQDYDLNWSVAALAFYTKFEHYKKDSSAAYAPALKDILQRRDAGFGQYAQQEKNATNLTEWLNTDEASAILASGDFYFPDMYNLPGFAKEEMMAQIHWWWMRNKGMCENVVDRARALKHQKVVVIAGANHRKYMQDIWADMPQVTVRNINELD